MKETYKVIKKYPNGPDVGTILQYKWYNVYEWWRPSTEFRELYTNEIASPNEIKNNPEFFAPFLFTTEDGVDIYYGDKYWLKRTDNELVECSHKWDLCYSEGAILKGQLVFSTKEAAQKYIDDLQKPKFKKGQWLYIDSKIGWKCILRFNEYTDSVSETFNVSESYTIYSGNYVEEKRFEENWSSNSNNLRPAEPNEIETILIAVAKHKGFREGVKFKSASTETKTICTGKFMYNSFDSLQSNRRDIYDKGKWAEIVEDVPEYVECVEVPDKWCLWKEMRVGRIFKTDEYAVLGDRYRLLFEDGRGQTISKDTEKYFKSSTKEAYEAQFKPVPYISTKVDSEQVVVSIDEGKFTTVTLEDKNVKIKYQVK